MKKLRVIILFGGRSAEHEVSLLSARNVFLALDRERFEPLLVGIDKQGHWRIEPDQTLLGATGDPRLLKLNAAGRELVVPVHPDSRELASSDENTRRLRQSSPFCGILSPEERLAILKEYESRRA